MRLNKVWNGSYRRGASVVEACKVLARQAIDERSLTGHPESLTPRGLQPALGEVIDSVDAPPLDNLHAVNGPYDPDPTRQCAPTSARNPPVGGVAGVPCWVSSFTECCGLVAVAG